MKELIDEDVNCYYKCIPYIQEGMEEGRWKSRTCEDVKMTCEDVKMTQIEFLKMEMHCLRWKIFRIGLKTY